MSAPRRKKLSLLARVKSMVPRWSCPVLPPLPRAPARWLYAAMPSRTSCGAVSIVMLGLALRLRAIGSWDDFMTVEPLHGEVVPRGLQEHWMAGYAARLGALLGVTAWLWTGILRFAAPLMGLMAALASFFLTRDSSLRNLRETSSLVALLLCCFSPALVCHSMAGARADGIAGVGASVVFLVCYQSVLCTSPPDKWARDTSFALRLLGKCGCGALCYMFCRSVSVWGPALLLVVSVHLLLMACTRAAQWDTDLFSCFFCAIVTAEAFLDEIPFQFLEFLIALFVYQCVQSAAMIGEGLSCCIKGSALRRARGASGGTDYDDNDDDDDDDKDIPAPASVLGTRFFFSSFGMLVFGVLMLGFNDRRSADSPVESRLVAMGGDAAMLPQLFTACGLVLLALPAGVQTLLRQRSVSSTLLLSYLLVGLFLSTTLSERFLVFSMPAACTVAAHGTAGAVHNVKEVTLRPRRDRPVGKEMMFTVWCFCSAVVVAYIWLAWVGAPHSSGQHLASYELPATSHMKGESLRLGDLAEAVAFMRANVWPSRTVAWAAFHRDSDLYTHLVPLMRGFLPLTNVRATRALTAAALLSAPDEGHALLEGNGMRFIVVAFGGLTGFPDDLREVEAMRRECKHWWGAGMCPAGKLEDTLLHVLSYKDFSSLVTHPKHPAGYDVLSGRVVRPAQQPHPALEKFEEVFTSRHGLLRVYRILHPGESRAE